MEFGSVDRSMAINVSVQPDHLAAGGVDDEHDDHANVVDTCTRILPKRLKAAIVKSIRPTSRLRGDSLPAAWVFDDCGGAGQPPQSQARSLLGARGWPAPSGYGAGQNPTPRSTGVKPSRRPCA